MRKIIINAFGPDKTGIVYQLSKIILGLNGNIENSKMIRMESDFAILMLVAISKNNIGELENKLKEIKDFNIYIKETDQFNKNIKYTKYTFAIDVADNEGIIYSFTELFKNKKINIEKMETEIKNAPISGFPMFILRTVIKIPNNLDIDDFKTSLKKIAKPNNVDYILELAK